MEGKADFWNLSNKLTLFRIGVIPVVALLLLSPGRVPNFVAAVLFLLAAITDTLDGYLARRRGTVTSLGKLLDPMADKLLLVTALIFLIPLGRVPTWAVAVIVARELAVTTLRGIAASRGVIIAASWLGKAKNLLQLAAANLLILHHPYFSIDPHRLGTYLLYIAVFFTVWSGLQYLWRYAAFSPQASGPRRPLSPRRGGCSRGPSAGWPIRERATASRRSPDGPCQR